MGGNARINVGPASGRPADVERKNIRMINEVDILFAGGASEALSHARPRWGACTNDVTRVCVGVGVRCRMHAYARADTVRA